MIVVLNLIFNSITLIAIDQIFGFKWAVLIALIVIWTSVGHLHTLEENKKKTFGWF